MNRDDALENQLILTIPDKLVYDWTLQPLMRQLTAKMGFVVRAEHLFAERAFEVHCLPSPDDVRCPCSIGQAAMRAVVAICLTTRTPSLRVVTGDNDVLMTIGGK